jgi:hypothetical protein
MDSEKKRICSNSKAYEASTFGQFYLPRELKVRVKNGILFSFFGPFLFYFEHKLIIILRSRIFLRT